MLKDKLIFPLPVKNKKVRHPRINAKVALFEREKNLINGGEKTRKHKIKNLLNRLTSIFFNTKEKSTTNNKPDKMGRITEIGSAPNTLPSS